MQVQVKLIYKTFTTHLPTVFPVQYFGSSDGRVYLIYARFYEKGFDSSGLEFVLAKHKEFCYDYELDTVTASEIAEKKKVIYHEEVDKPEPNIKIIKVYRNISSYSAAIKKLNKKITKGLKEKTNESDLL